MCVRVSVIIIIIQIIMTYYYRWGTAVLITTLNNIKY